MSFLPQTKAASFDIWQKYCKRCCFLIMIKPDPAIRRCDGCHIGVMTTAGGGGRNKNNVNSTCCGSSCVW